jgi:nucleoside-diphosphate-sugar epimerase
VNTKRKTPSSAPDVFVTGGTGFVGHYVLTELLRQGRRCGALLRAPLSASLSRLTGLLGGLGIDVTEAIAAGRLVPVQGDLLGDAPMVRGLNIGVIVHVAAATQFDRDSTGEPWRTNVQGTGGLLGWAAAWGVRELHQVSTAYCCGKAGGVIAEQFREAAPVFRNEYEQSKWEAERLSREWAVHTGSSLTVYRPSVVVGAYETGRASKFDGLYLSARATEALSRMYEPTDPARHALALRLRGRPEGCQNLVPVDYVAAMIGAAIARQTMHGRIYHLVHPRPPTNQTIADGLNRHFDVSGSRWVAPESFDEMSLTEHERLFNEFSRPIAHYFVDTPTFARENAAELERLAGLACGVFDQAAISRLMSFAQASRWGKRRLPAGPAAEASCAEYFERFLPRNVPRSQVAKMTGLSVTVRFIIEDEADGQWVCRFERGALAQVHRGMNTLHEDFGYRLTREVFWRAVGGKVHPQHAFLTGEVEIVGDVERALKMAMILHAFNQEFPFDRASQPSGDQPCLLQAC